MCSNAVEIPWTWPSLGPQEVRQFQDKENNCVYSGRPIQGWPGLLPAQRPLDLLVSPKGAHHCSICVLKASNDTTVTCN